jgi:hypothetical protein
MQAPEIEGAIDTGTFLSAEREVKHLPGGFTPEPVRAAQ